MGLDLGDIVDFLRELLLLLLAKGASVLAS